MKYIRVTEENIDTEQICCAMSNKQSLGKKKWLRERMAEGLVFYRSEERGNCFIEYLPAEMAWVPISAPNYLYIDCMWVEGAMKGKGCGGDLLAYCVADAEARGKAGICILSSEKKREFLSDSKFLTHKGFRVADVSDCGITLMYLPLTEAGACPKFKECAKHPTVTEQGWTVYYTQQCPFAEYWAVRVANAARAAGIELKTMEITDRETAQNMTAPVTTYALFYRGKFMTHAIQSDKKFLALAKKTMEDGREASDAVPETHGSESA